MNIGYTGLKIEGIYFYIWHLKKNRIMKSKAIVLLLILIPLLNFAQKDELLLGLSIGLSNPMGDFAKNEIMINDNGELETNGQFAKNGLAFDFSANYRLGYYFGFAGRILGGTNKIDLNEYNNILEEQLSGTNSDLIISSKGWGNAGGYLGAYLVIPVNNLYIDARIMAGYMNLFAPQFNYLVYEDGSLTETYIQEKYSAGGFSYDFGLGLKYKFSGNQFLLLNGDYVAADIIKDNIKTVNPITQEPTTTSMDIQYQNLTFTIGVGYIF